jgi:hypothetical protein
MIDEEQLEECADTDQIEVCLRGHSILFLGEEAAELIRLARLGLWAEKHGIPALESYSGEVANVGEDEVYIGRTADEAIAALPTLPPKHQ